ncbi:uncharacterized protein J3R85_014601 [Psidium guajava]|nr:uncharacterized protein J3R85_014601 [Psidium guajava]
MDGPPSLSYYPITNDRDDWGSHEGYNSNNELVSNHDHNHQDHNSNRTDTMMASKEPSYMTAGMNVTHHGDPWKDRGIFNQDMGHRLGLALWSNTTGLDVTSSSSCYLIMNDRAGQGSHEGYNSNNEPCVNDTNPHHAHAHDGLIYPELGSNHDRDHQDHQYMAD